MVTATITSKGQITIPKSVRESLQLHTGDRVVFEVHGRDKAILKPITKSVDDVFGKLHRPTMAIRSVGDMNQAIQSHMRHRKS